MQDQLVVFPGNRGGIYLLHMLVRNRIGKGGCSQNVLLGGSVGIAALELGNVVANFFRKSLKSEYLNIDVSCGESEPRTVCVTSS